jgi:putative mRNA 3-end processing factor
MNNGWIGVTASGVVLLGPDVACDGFHRDYNVRVQTHVHLDHMHSFETSKGMQDIYLTSATLQLLIAEFNAELPVRDNLIEVPIGSDHLVGSSRVKFLNSDHMLGSVQVQVEMTSGRRIGYSGDFQWPLNDVIGVDELVLDSTYGSPDSVRRYSQEEAEERLLRVAIDKLQKGPLHIKAHRGTVHRGLQVLSEVEGCPFLASPRMCAEIEVYRAFGYPIGPVCSLKSPEAKEVLKSRRYVRFYGVGDQFPIQIETGTTITLSAFMTNPNEPVLEYSDRALSVALTNHADFNGTLEYVRATGAKRVITDNSRGGHAVELAAEISRQLGIQAQPSELEPSNEWGL